MFLIFQFFVSANTPLSQALDFCVFLPGLLTRAHPHMLHMYIWARLWDRLDGVQLVRVYMYLVCFLPYGLPNMSFWSCEMCMLSLWLTRVRAPVYA